MLQYVFNGTSHISVYFVLAYIYIYIYIYRQNKRWCVMKSLKEMEDVNREGKAQIKRQRKEEGTSSCMKIDIKVSRK